MPTMDSLPSLPGPTFHLARSSARTPPLSSLWLNHPCAVPRGCCICRCTTAVCVPSCGTRVTMLPTIMHSAAPRRSSTMTADAAGSRLHETAGQGPQPETLFRPDAAALSGGHPAAAAALGGASGGEEGGRPLKDGELPGFGGLPVGPDYGAERPQEQTAPEPDNPLPGDLPPNHPQREGEAPPEGPGPLEVPLPHRDEPDMPLKAPPEVGGGGAGL